MLDLDINAVFDNLEKSAKNFFHDIKMEKASADHIAKEVRDHVSTLKEYEVCIDISSKHVLILIRAL